VALTRQAVSAVKDWMFVVLRNDFVVSKLRTVSVDVVVIAARHTACGYSS